MNQRAKIYRYVLCRTQLPHHAKLYWKQCNGRQRAIINRVTGFEKRGYKHVCNASTNWWIKEYLPSWGINISESTFRRDLLHLEKIGLIRRNIWNKPREVGGKVRVMYSAWGLENYARFFLYKNKNPKYNNKDKPPKVFDDYFNFKREIKELTQEFWKQHRLNLHDRSIN